MPKETLTSQPLAACHLSPLNPRASVTDAEIAALAGSIRTLGLIQSLAGWEAAPGRIEIVAGGRRLRALRLIASEDGIAEADYPVPVMLAGSEDEARDWAKGENIVRKALHPAEEIAAYRDMAEAGAEPEAIAKAFAVTVRHVRGRLRLAGLAEPILAALRSDEITLDVAQAYSIAPDPEQQAALFAELSGGYFADNPREIRRRLTDQMVDPRDRLARLVGRAAYEAAGGEVREDLFGEDVFFTDPGLLTDLAMKALGEARAVYVAEGWSWVEAGIERPSWDSLAGYARTYPERVQASEEEAARYDAIAERIDSGAATEAEEVEFEALSADLDRQIYSDAQKTLAGVILSVGYDGEITADRGLIRAEDRAAAEAAEVCQPSRHERSGSNANTRKGPYSAALARDLATIRTGALQAALLDQPHLVLDLLTFVLATPIFAASNPVGLTTSAPQNIADEAAGQTLPKALRDDPDAPLSGTEAAAAFAAFRRKKPATKSRILTESVVRLVSAGLVDEDANPFLEAIVEMASLDVRRTWQPNEWFLNRMTASRLQTVLGEIRGDDGGQVTGLRKREKVARLAAIFEEAPGAIPLSEDAKARAAAWLPEGMGGPSSEESAIAAE